MPGNVHVCITAPALIASITSVWVSESKGYYPHIYNSFHAMINAVADLGGTAMVAIHLRTRIFVLLSVWQCIYLACLSRRRGATAATEAVRSPCVFQYSQSLWNILIKTMAVASHRIGYGRISACHASRAPGLALLVSTFECVLSP
jgi:hypothetical protein